jgi:hypothetical protein
MKLNRYLPAILSLLSTVVLAGCTHNLKFVKARSLPTPASPGQIPLRVELRITDEYQKATWEMHFMGTTRVPFGPHLATNTANLARGVFSDVSVTSQGLEAPTTPGAMALLVPRLAYVDVSGNATSLGKSYLTMAIEWSLFDASKKLVWVDSYRAGLKGPVEGARGEKERTQRLWDAVLTDILRQTREGMLASPDIRRFCQSATAR